MVERTEEYELWLVVVAEWVLFTEVWLLIPITYTYTRIIITTNTLLLCSNSLYSTEYTYKNLIQSRWYLSLLVRHRCPTNLPIYAVWTLYYYGCICMSVTHNAGDHGSFHFIQLLLYCMLAASQHILPHIDKRPRAALLADLVHQHFRLLVHSFQRGRRCLP